MSQSEGSTPSLLSFDPKVIPFQRRVIYDVRKKFSYEKGFHQLLFSGTVGSSKSLLLAHLLITHCLLYPKACAYFGRLVLGDLKKTLLKKIVQHLGRDLIEGKDYEHNKSDHVITFQNGSELVYGSWHDKDYTKFRSLELSAVGIEEATENSEEYKDFYFEIIQRVNRLPHVKENWVALATNPDGPSHWIHKHFMENQDEFRHVYYSNALENPFLPKSYIENLKGTLDPKMARRMLYGEWIDIDGEFLYHNYRKDRNYLNRPYEFSANQPIDLSHDFNIGEGKPMSANISQTVGGVFHFSHTFAVDGARTADIMEEMGFAGIFENKNKFRVFGDASGKRRDTRSIKSDYDIIREYLANYRRKDGSSLDFEMLIPLSNPPIRERHNLVNAQFLDALGQVKLYVYKDATMLDEGFRLTKLKQTGSYIEDDSFRAQHCTTAAGYAIFYQLRKIKERREAYRR